jgi:hypothetical protein
MKSYMAENPVLLTPTEKTIRRNRGLLQLISDDSLFRNMYKAAWLEEYERAAIYRDELIRRRKLEVAV